MIPAPASVMASPIRFDRQRAKSAVRVVTGNFLEMYDFSVFGYYAAAIGRVYFPSTDPFASLMSALMIFGAGFLMRPLGALILGPYIDRRGRRAGLLLTLGLMSVGTLLISIVPGYNTIGLFAPLLVVLGRLIQGFSAGAEIGGVSVYLSEIAPPGRRGLYVAWQPASQQVAVVLVALVGVGLSFALPPEALDAWGWRIPFLIGCMIIPLLFLLRQSLQETDAFLARTHHPGTAEALRSIAANWRPILVGIFMMMMSTVWFQTITAYTPTFGKEVLGLTGIDTLIVTLCIGISNFVWLPIMGGLSDVFGRRLFLVGFTSVAIVTAYPSMSWLVHDPSFARLLMVELWLSFLYGGYNGAMVVALAEIMPPNVRVSGFSVAYSFATAIFGGFSPAISQYLIHITNNNAMPGAWLSVAAGGAFIAAWLVRPDGAQYDQSGRLFTNLPPVDDESVLSAANT
jgi:MFS transporter, MHS family, citrate/tricarballylate:H+ symporter